MHSLECDVPLPLKVQGDLVELVGQGLLGRDGVAKGSSHLRREASPEEGKLTLSAEMSSIRKLEVIRPRRPPCTKLTERYTGRELRWRWSGCRAAGWGARGLARSGRSRSCGSKLVLQSCGGFLALLFLLLESLDESLDVPL